MKKVARNREQGAGSREQGVGGKEQGVWVVLCISFVYVSYILRRS